MPCSRGRLRRGGLPLRATPSKKGGGGAPLAGAAAGLMPSPPVATTTRARTQFGTEGLRDLAKEFVGQ